MVIKGSVILNNYNYPITSKSILNVLISNHIRLGCQIYGFNASVAALAEVWSLAAVALDRLQAIYHPLEAKKRITKRQVLYCLIKQNEKKKQF